ncbi:MAG: ATP-binding cassette domain-containing protein [Oscillospiraceae bacterium]
MIKISNLTKLFDSGKSNTKALDNINLHIERGDAFGIIGMSGAGKSTLLKCLAMLVKPTQGEIYIDNINVNTADKKDILEIRREMGVVFQGYNLLNQSTIFENIAFPLKLIKASKSEINSRVNQLLKLIDLEDKANSYISQLSGGQKQRVAIARALATNPKVILCDEPTSALDPLTTKQILKLLKNINTQMQVTIVIITHEIDVVKSICNKVAIINDGKVVENGNTNEVFSTPKCDITKSLLDWSVS